MTATPATSLSNNNSPTPSVGIFWGIPDGAGTNLNRALVVDATPLSAAEPYGAALTHPRGHYDV